MIKHINCQLLMILLFVGCSSYQMAFVNAASGLRVRSNADINSDRLSLLPYKEEVRIIEKNEKLINIDGFENYWYKIQKGDLTGWIFGGYLSFVHPSLLPPNANSYTGLVYYNPIKSLRLKLNHPIVPESLYLNVYESVDQKHLFVFLEQRIQLDQYLIEWKVLHGFNVTVLKNEDIVVPGNFQCETPGSDSKEIQLAFLTTKILKTGATIGNHYELVFKKLKVRKAWVFSDDMKYLIPVEKTKGIRCIIPDPANDLQAVSE